MNLLNVRQLSMTYGVEPLFEDVGFGLDVGERVAVVGPNGCGKSTLFKILAGRVRPDAGKIALRGETTIAYLPQKADFDPDVTPREVVARAVSTLREAIERHREVSNLLGLGTDEEKELLVEQAELQERIRNLGGWDWQHRVEEMLDRLGIFKLIDRPVGGMSGGQQRRVDLARVLLEGADIVLLDEPTNHLDTGAVEWLEGWLKTHVTSLLLVTHDRYFLERVVDRILEIDVDGFFDYPGNYETFMERKLQRMAIRRRTEERRQHLLKKELEWLRGGMKASTTRSKKRLQQLEELKEEGPAYEQERMKMELAGASQLGDVILAARGLHKSYGDNQLLEGASISLRPGDKLGIIGKNGCGKSTLLRLLLGEEAPDAGAVEIGKLTEIGYLRQEEAHLDLDDTVFEAMGVSDYVWVGDRRYHKKDYLQLFLFDKDLQKSKLRVLSGGQRRRFALAKLVAENANVLVLDEPTNDLDILSLQAMESALDDFDGCIIAVSHDRYFLNRICTSIIAFEDKKLVRYEGDYDDYRRAIDRDAHVADDATIGREEQGGRQRSQDAGSARKLTYAERLRLEELEAEIAEVEAARESVEAKLADPELYASRPDEIEPLNRELREVSARLDELLETWAELEERRG